MEYIKHISEFLIRKKWEIMVSEDFRVLRDVPKKYITQAMCENAVKDCIEEYDLEQAKSKLEMENFHLKRVNSGLKVVNFYLKRAKSKLEMENSHLKEDLEKYDN